MNCKEACSFRFSELGFLRKEPVIPTGEIKNRAAIVFQRRPYIERKYSKAVSCNYTPT